MNAQVGRKRMQAVLEVGLQNGICRWPWWRIQDSASRGSGKLNITAPGIGRSQTYRHVTTTPTTSMHTWEVQTISIPQRGKTLNQVRPTRLFRWRSGAYGAGSAKLS